MSKAKQSPFAAALEGALRSFGVSFETLAVWMGIFATDPVKKIEGWIADTSVPLPDELWRLVCLLRDHRAPEDPAGAERYHAVRAEFARILDERGSRVSPHGKRFIGTPGTYMQRSQLAAFEAALATLPAAEQEEILRKAMLLTLESRKAPSTRGILDHRPD